MTETLNQSGLAPLGRAVLIEPYAPEQKKGQIVIPEHVQANMATVELRARVIAVGPAAWEDESSPRAKPGDIVLVTKYAGIMAVGPADKKQYRLINDRDVFCQVTSEGAV